MSKLRDIVLDWMTVWCGASFVCIFVYVATEGRWYAHEPDSIVLYIEIAIALLVALAGLWRLIDDSRRCK